MRLMAQFLPNVLGSLKLRGFVTSSKQSNRRGQDTIANELALIKQNAIRYNRDSFIPGASLSPNSGNIFSTGPFSMRIEAAKSIYAPRTLIGSIKKMEQSQRVNAS